MTRVNVGIPPEQLSRQHLLAEHREIKRIPNAVAKGRANLAAPAPPRFTLGPGHVRFFYTRLGYLKQRYEALYAECQRRGYSVTYYGAAWTAVPEHLLGDYTPTRADVRLIKARIAAKTHGQG